MFDDPKINRSVDSHYESVRRSELNQSDIAKANRIIRERKESYVNLDAELNRQMKNAVTNSDFETFQSLAAQAKSLAELGGQIDKEERIIDEIIGNATIKRQGRVPEEIKTEIHNLYHAGVSNQMQLAKDYDISQGTVNTIVNDDPSKYRRSK